MEKINNYILTLRMQFNLSNRESLNLLEREVWWWCCKAIWLLPLLHLSDWK